MCVTCKTGEVVTVEIRELSTERVLARRIMSRAESLAYMSSWNAHQNDDLREQMAYIQAHDLVVPSLMPHH